MAGGHVDETFLAERVTGLPELRRALDDYDPDRVSRIAGVPAEMLGQNNVQGASDMGALPDLLPAISGSPTQTCTTG